MKKCQKCGTSDHMSRVIDRKYNVVDTRSRVCFKCEFTILERDEGELVYFQDDESQDETQAA